MVKEWSGSCCPLDPDNYWIDDATGGACVPRPGKERRPSHWPA